MYLFILIFVVMVIMVILTSKLIMKYNFSVVNPSSWMLISRAISYSVCDMYKLLCQSPLTKTFSKCSAFVTSVTNKPLSSNCLSILALLNLYVD